MSLSVTYDEGYGDLDAASGEDPVPLLPEHHAGPRPQGAKLGHWAVQPERGANLHLDIFSQMMII